MKSVTRLLPTRALCLLMMLGGLSAAQTPQPQKRPETPEVKYPPPLSANPLKEEPDDGPERKLLKARYNAAVGELKDYYEFAALANKHGISRLYTPDGLYGPWKRLVQAGLELYDKPADKLVLLTQYLEITKEVEKDAQAQYDAGRTRIGDLHRARYERLDAEIRLLRAKREADKAKDK